MARYSCMVERIDSDSGSSKILDSKELVPGDLIVVPEGKSLPCDLILLTGSTIINESMLTGESIPVLKNSLPSSSSQIYSDQQSESHILHGGTKVIQTRPVGDSKVCALVKNTGF